MIEFKNPDVAAKYKSLRSKDGRVHVPGGRKVPGIERIGYNGPLSLITLEAADASYASKSGLLELKTPDQAGAGSKASLQIDEE